MLKKKFTRSEIKFEILHDADDTIEYGAYYNDLIEIWLVRLKTKYLETCLGRQWINSYIYSRAFGGQVRRCSGDPTGEPRQREGACCLICWRHRRIR
jgi:hypothetical protein